MSPIDPPSDREARTPHPASSVNAPPAQTVADDVLPQVVAPTAGFLLQLFFIPFFIVLIIVVVWVMFTWLAHVGHRPEDLVKKLNRGDEAGWQAAGSLADMLRDPRQEHVKHDVQLAVELGKILKTKRAAGPPVDDNQTKICIFLCRALGEFRTDKAMAPLIEASGEHRNLNELDMRREAVRGLAILAENLGPEKLSDNKQLLDTLVTASRARSNSSDEAKPLSELRSSAAFALGVLGGDEALDRLETMLGDSHLNTRFNAATGLTRHGDERATPILLEMLDPENDAAVQGEKSESTKEWKQGLVNVNGVRAAEMLARENPQADFSQIHHALERLMNDSPTKRIRAEAAKAMHVIENRKRSRP